MNSQPRSGIVPVFTLLGILAMLPWTTAQAADKYWVDSDGNPVRHQSGCVIGIYGQNFPECGGEMKMMPADSDGDGVNDDMDRCPNTPAGASVDSRGCTVVADSDGDGVNDDMDRCPNTPAGASVDSRGCTVVADSDGDGVNDDMDRCPNTPAGAEVDSKGCLRKVVLQNLNFTVNKAELTADSKAALDEMAATLKGNPAVRQITITGHTDSSGAAAYNQMLSEKRARAVGDYFISKGIAADKITTQGMGETQPVADNATSAGRLKNRRVELAVE